MAKEINQSKRLDLFAATPPLESIRYILSSCARQFGRGTLDVRVMINDVRRAYFCAPVKREVYVALPQEDLDEHDDVEEMVGKLRLSMYGTRDAAQNWALEYSQTLISMGFVQGVASPCHFHHPDKDLKTAVRGDDFVSTGSKRHLRWMKKSFE